MTDEKLRGIIGLAVRARQIVLGETMTIQAIRSNHAELALLDDSASANAFKKITDACENHAVPLAIVESSFLDGATGKDGRKAAAILKGSLANQALKILSQAEKGSGYILYSKSLSHNAGVQGTNDQG
jgi:ribosomal protein L7Ae-like RNA K-turn-binding protein